MRIPPSVIVMSVVTAVPFGLGIRDSLQHKPARPTLDEGLDGYKERERAMEDYEAEMRRAATEREKRIDAKKARLDVLFGGKPAQLGSLLEGIEVGSSAGTFQPEYVRRRIDNATHDGLFEITFDAKGATLDAVHVRITGDDEQVCGALRAKLTAAWGTPTNDTWVDAAAKRRAAFDDDRCELSFERYLEPAEWVAALPLDAIGKPAQPFIDGLPNADSDGERASWALPGLRFGKGGTKLEAYVVNGHIVGVKATVDSDFDSMLGARDAINARVKMQAKKDESTGVWSWKRSVPVTLDPSMESGTERFSVLIGKMPWD